MRGKKKHKDTKDSPKSFVVSAEEKKKAISSSLEFSQINREVDRITYWISEEEEKLAKNPDHKALLYLDFKYSDKLRRAIVDTVLRILGARLLTEEERADRSRPPSTGLQATNRPNLFIYYEFKRAGGEISMQEKYFLLVSKEMQIPKEAIPDKSEAEVDVKPEKGSSLEEKSRAPQPKERPPGIFKTMNELFLGDEEEKY